MILFSFKQCSSESEVRKVKKIYLIAFIVLFIISGLTVGLISQTVITPMYEELGEVGGDDFSGIEQIMEKSERLLTVIRPIWFLSEVFVFYLTVWACLKMGMGKIASILWGIVTLAPLVSFIPFIIILTRKFSPS